MRKFFIYLCSSVVLFSTIVFVVSCNKTGLPENENESLPINSSFALKSGGSGIRVTTDDVYSYLTSFQKEVTIHNPDPNNQFPKIYITFVSADEDDIYDQIKNRPATVNGDLYIESEGVEKIHKKVTNGEWADEPKRVPGPVHNPSVPCSVGTVHDCVAYELEANMNWIQVGACLLAAPECYSFLWLSCAWEVCNNQMQYTNPN